MTGSRGATVSLSRRLSLSSLAAVLAVTAVVTARSDAAAHSTGPTQSAVSSGVTDDRIVIKTHPRESSKFTTFRLDFVAGAVTPWHSHTGPGLVTVIDGTFVLTWAGEDGCQQLEYSKGDAFVDPGDGRLHQLLATSAGAVTATFVTPADQPATVPTATAPTC